MPRQNRVNPFGELISTDARGAFMGNRGVLHDANGLLTAKRWTHQQWIICQLEFKGRSRPLMAAGCYTELFFFDEATALAAGHRPCWECRRGDFTRFKKAWLKGNPQYGFADNVKIGEIDKILQRERTTPGRDKVTYEDSIGNLPDGTFFTVPDQPDTAVLIWLGSQWKWNVNGYEEFDQLSPDIAVKVLTPASTVNALRDGFVPLVSL